MTSSKWKAKVCDIQQESFLVFMQIHCRNQPFWKKWNDLSGLRIETKWLNNICGHLLQKYLLSCMNLMDLLDILVRKELVQVYPRNVMTWHKQSKYSLQHVTIATPSNIKQLKWAKMPFVSSEFCDQFQVDLIAMTTRRKRTLDYDIKRSCHCFN